MRKNNGGEDANKPAWQLNPVFKFFASVRLAMVLLGVLIIASIAGTIYESSFDAKVARAYVYGARWFNVWLLLLVINLAVSALSRIPWKKHHTGFLITHLGIITVIAGAYIGRTWGIEGTMTLFKGEPPSNRLMIDERVVQVIENESQGKAVPLEILHRKPTPEQPRNLMQTASGYQLSATDYAPLLEVEMTPKSLPEGGVPAVHISISTEMMKQTLNSWLMADDPAHGAFDMGLASIQFKRGTAPDTAAGKPAEQVTSASNEPVDIEEAIFVFSKASDQVSKSLKGGTTGAKVKLVDVTKQNNGTVVVDLNGVSKNFDVATNLGKGIPVEGTPYTLTIKNYWPDFRIQNGAPTSLSDEPNNPGILIALTGRAVPASVAADDAHGGMASEGGQNRLVIYRDDKGQLTYELSARKGGKSSGKLEPNTPLPTGWADWKLTVDQVIAHAEEHFTARPVTQTAPGGKSRHTEGVRVRAARGSEKIEEWVPLGWQITLPAQPKPFRVSYGFRQQPLPISLRLLDFEVQRNEGTDTPAGFKSTVEITNLSGETTTGQCWMNNPISYPGSWLNTFSGLTYKISQASWNPENLNQSSVQILRDPGWGFKWIGSLCVVAGVFTLFYLRPYPKDLQPPNGRQSKSSVKSNKPARVPVGV